MKMTEKKAKWLNQRSKALGGSLSKELTNKNKASEVYYRIALTKEFDKFFDFILKKIEKEYKPVKSNTLKSQNSLSGLVKLFDLLDGKYSNLFFANTFKIISKFLFKNIKSSKNTAKENIKELFGNALKINYDKSLDVNLKIAINENVNLIKNMSNNLLTQIKSVVYNSMTEGKGWADIQDNLFNQKDLTKKRVKKIARDQTAKANADINRLTQQSLGIEYFEWDGARDERERAEHNKLNGKIYKWNDIESRLPIIDKKGTRGYPSQAVLCRCMAKAVIIMSGYNISWSNESKSYLVVKENKK